LDTIAEVGTAKVGRPLYVQYGCGLRAPEGWLNFDNSPRLRVERMPILRYWASLTVGTLFPANVRFGNIVRGLPVRDGLAIGVYCSHVIEHLPRDDVPKALKNTLRIMSPGGVFRLVVPDLGWRVARYTDLANNHDSRAADTLIDGCLIGQRTKPKNLTSLARAQFGNSAHLWMYDFAALESLLRDAGFEQVRRCELGDARDPMFGAVEEPSRFFDQGERELAIEAMRPQRDRDGTAPAESET
jgi:SAM-dependent methyltransferase